MARPFKSGVGYFPLDVLMEDEVELIESEHSIIGFAVLIKLYQKIYAIDYWLKWDKKSLIVFSKRINVDSNKVNDIINSCFEWGLLDNELFKKHQILTSKGIQKRFFEIVKRRKKIDVIKEYLLIDTLVYVDINSINVCESTQSKVKKRKEKKSKENLLKNKEKFIENIPGSVFKKGHSKEQVLQTVDDLIDYCEANGKTYKDYYAALRNFLKKVIPESNNNLEKLPLEKYKEAFQWKKDNQNKKFKEKSLNKIIIQYPYIIEYEFDSKKFELTYKDYLKL